MAGLDGEIHPAILTHGHQAIEGLSIRTAALHNGIGPNVEALWPPGARRSGTSPLAVPPYVQVESALLPEAIDSLVIHVFPLPP
jgi:hypothetical protein